MRCLGSCVKRALSRSAWLMGSVLELDAGRYVSRPDRYMAPRMAWMLGSYMH
jgi:hypothetical protein